MDEYTINVAMLGAHVFNIVLPAGTSKDSAISMANALLPRFPEADGFDLELLCVQRVGRRVAFKTAG